MFSLVSARAAVTLACCIAPGAWGLGFPGGGRAWARRGLRPPSPTAAGPGARHRPRWPFPTERNALQPSLSAAEARGRVIHSPFLLTFFLFSEFWGCRVSSRPHGYKRNAGAVAWNSAGLALRWHACGTCQRVRFPCGAALCAWKQNPQMVQTNLFTCVSTGEGPVF